MRTDPMGSRGAVSRVCKRCKAEKPINEFREQSHRPGLYLWDCRPCEIERARERRRAYRAAHPIEPWTPPTEKKCCDCGEVKPADEFNFHKKARGTRKSYCRPCQSAQQKAYEEKNLARVRARKRDSRLKSRYRMSRDEAEERFAAVGGRCQACHQLPTNGNPLCFDHDHSCCPGEKTCGKCIRGVLCRQCNVALGSVRDDLARVRALVTYLEVAVYA